MSDIKVVSIQNDDAPFYMDVNSSDEVIPIDLHVLIGGKGDPGPAGQGFPAGGVAGQVLMKIDAVDYNTEWSDIGYLNDNPVPTTIGGITTGTSFPTAPGTRAATRCRCTGACHSPRTRPSPRVAR